MIEADSHGRGREVCTANNIYILSEHRLPIADHFRPGTRRRRATGKAWAESPRVSCEKKEVVARTMEVRESFFHTIWSRALFFTDMRLRKARQGQAREGSRWTIGPTRKLSIFSTDKQYKVNHWHNIIRGTRRPTLAIPSGPSASSRPRSSVVAGNGVPCTIGKRRRALFWRCRRQSLFGNLGLPSTTWRRCWGS